MTQTTPHHSEPEATPSNGSGRLEPREVPTAAMLPLLARFPALAVLPRAELGRFPSPVEFLPGTAARPPLWLKRDDLNTRPPHLGGNKVRALEFLLGDIRPGDTVITLGGEGSTHVLATVRHAARLGARTVIVRWPHEMNDVACVIARASALGSSRSVRVPSAVIAVLAAALERIRLRSGRARIVPIGGSTPIGTLGHVNAALELVRQVEAGLLPTPGTIVVPLGSGGTAAGLSLGLAIAGLPTQVIAARIAPRLGTNEWRVRRLAHATARLIERYSGERITRVARDQLCVDHTVFGGAFGRALPVGEAIARKIAAEHGLRLDGIYGAKAIAAAVAAARDRGAPTLYWVTFDTRALDAPRDHESI
jgi:D-cysteine desulfhydrase